MTLVLHDISHQYRAGSPVLRGVSCALGPGITAIIGPNGAGKTTLARIAAGLLKPTGGRATLNEQDVYAMKSPERARAIAYIPQRSTVAALFTARQVVALGRYALGASDAAVRQALSDVEQLASDEEPFATLSAGQQQRTVLARALAQLHGERDAGRPGAVLIGDEPFSAMDTRHMLRCAALLRRRADAGLCVALVLHDLTLARRVADRALVLDGAGAVVAFDAVEKALTAPVLARALGVQFDEVATPGGPALVARGPGPTAMADRADAHFRQDSGIG